MAQHAQGERETLELSARIEVDPSGKPTRAAVDESPGSQAHSSPALRACARAALQQVAFECSADGQPATVTADICLRFDEPR
jgi:hypothetical protein